MPNINVKNAANADKTFTFVSPAAGFESLATWQLREGAIQGVFPVLTAMAKPTANQSQVGKLRFRVPSSFVDSSTGQVNVGPSVEFNLTVSIPKAFPESSKDDAVAYFQELIASAPLSAFLRDAFPVTS